MPSRVPCELRTPRTWIILSTLVVSAAASSAQDTGMASLERLSEALRRAASWSAEYRQAYTPAGMTTGEESAGSVWIGWPDRALFLTGDPVVRAMGLEGRLVRLLDLEVPSCDEHVLSDEEWARVPLAAVLDPRGTVDRFTVVGTTPNVFVLVPRDPGGVDRVEVTLNDGGLPSEVVIVDPQGATNRLVFTAWHPSDGPPADAWLPEPPVGLECIAD